MIICVDKWVEKLIEKDPNQIGILPKSEVDETRVFIYKLK